MDPEELMAALTKSEAYHHRPSRVEWLQTHISWIFLADDLVYKVKKPVDFGFLDFSTLANRKHFCEEEVRLNRRLCPDIYLGVEPIIRDQTGRVVFGGDGPPLEFAVKMRRLPEEGMMLRRLARNEVDEKEIDRIAGLLVPFYRCAETGGRVNHFGRPELIEHNIHENFDQTADYVGLALSRGRYDSIREYCAGFLKDRTGLLSRRVDTGFIRDCHGDLHMANICLGERVWIFDCIEFNERFRFSDVASDISFLAMDLDFYRRADLSDRLIEVYVRMSGDRELTDLLDFYKCYRSYVRGKIHCFTAHETGLSALEKSAALKKARCHFTLAYQYAGGQPRLRILVFMGLMGTGKSYWAGQAGRCLGAEVVGTDRVRKQLAGQDPETRHYVAFGQGLYSPEMSGRVYQEMLDRAEEQVRAGLDVVLDGAYLKEAERRRIVSLAVRCGAEVTFVHVRAAERVVRARLANREARGHSVSDGRLEISDQQARLFEAFGDLSPAKVIRLDTGGPEDEVGRTLRQALKI